jgi:hypothetical protein
MDSERPIAEIEALLAAKGEHLRRTATLLAGGPDNGEDLLQEALERMFRRWRAAIAASMRALLSCGGLSISWHQHYHGTEAIKIVSHARPATLEVTQVIWVNEATYLPIAVTTPGGTASPGTATTQYAWLPPTKANLANLTVAIPPGFTVVTAKSAPPTGLSLPYAEIAWLFALAGY